MFPRGEKPVCKYVQPAIKTDPVQPLNDPLPKMRIRQEPERIVYSFYVRVLQLGHKIGEISLFAAYPRIADP
jgi:hypothetical protein